ncbi:MAG: prepilin-type N-terminal cleavage/methylation domain-containing protein, partial [Verrucomicrobia bacterium]|nr:prepilin-type N-terminal cleavage/methylation domain-containing protein [Verrucomicrobiota bacterium]
MVNSARQKSRYRQGGFSLVEMSVCLGIIVIFLSVVMTVTLVANRSYGVIRDNDELLK